MTELRAYPSTSAGFSLTAPRAYLPDVERGRRAMVPLANPLILMTDPGHFEVSYVINPWMKPGAWCDDAEGHSRAARRAFDALAEALEGAGAVIERIDGRARPARHGVSGQRGRRARPPRAGRPLPLSRAARRRAAVPEGLRGLQGARAARRGRAIPGRLLPGRRRRLHLGRHARHFWAGFGQRSAREAADAVAGLLRRAGRAAGARRPRFYHLDTCFWPLSRRRDPVTTRRRFPTPALAAIRDARRRRNN